MNCLCREFKNIYSSPDYKGEDTSNLLSVIFGKGSSNAKSIEVANKLLSSYDNNLKALERASGENLIKIIGRNNTKVFLAAMEFFRQVSLFQPKDTPICSPENVAQLLMNEMKYYKKEVFKVILLDTKNQVIKVDTISVGILDASIVHPREIFYSAIKETASSLILVHNHPSGNPAPSQQDIEITKNIMAAGKIINIEVMDHIIIGDKFISLKEKKFI